MEKYYLETVYWTQRHNMIETVVSDCPQFHDKTLCNNAKKKINQLLITTDNLNIHYSNYPSLSHSQVRITQGLMLLLIVTTYGLSHTSITLTTKRLFIKKIQKNKIKRLCYFLGKKIMLLFCSIPYHLVLQQHEDSTYSLLVNELLIHCTY